MHNDTLVCVMDKIFNIRDCLKIEQYYPQLLLPIAHGNAYELPDFPSAFPI